MLGLGVKVHVNTSELIEAESRIAHFADHFERTFMRKFSHAFGAGGLAIGAIKSIESIFGKPEEIDKAARKFQISTEAVQLLQKYAEQTGQTFEEVWEKAKKGAIDLDKVLAEMRAKGTPVIGGKNISAINQNREAASGAWEGLRDGVINLIGGTIRRISDPNNQEAMRNAMNATPGFGGPTARNLAAKGRMDEYKPMGGEEEESDAEGFSHNEPGIQSLKRRLAIKAEIERLQKSKKGIGNNELIGGTLTSRQAIGAYTAQQGSVVSKIEEGNKLLEGIDAKIEALKSEMEKLE